MCLYDFLKCFVRIFMKKINGRIFYIADTFFFNFLLAFREFDIIFYRYLLLDVYGNVIQHIKPLNSL